MANEVSIKSVVNKFNKELKSVSEFIKKYKGDSNGVFVSYLYDYAIIKVFKDFEELLQNTIIGIINQESSYNGQKKSIKKRDAEILFNDDKRYFSFNGADGLLSKIKKKNFFQSNHWFVNILSDTKYDRTFELFIPLRNYAAHSSKHAKSNALNAIKKGRKNLSYSGAWLKVEYRFTNIINDLKNIATRINAKAKF